MRQPRCARCTGRMYLEHDRHGGFIEFAGWQLHCVNCGRIVHLNNDLTPATIAPPRPDNERAPRRVTHRVRPLRPLGVAR